MEWNPQLSFLKPQTNSTISENGNTAKESPQWTHTEITERINYQNVTYMQSVLIREIPESIQIDRLPSQAEEQPDAIAKHFKNVILSECKSEGKHFAFRTVTTALERFYFGCEHHTQTHILASSWETAPLLSIVGVPGAGKSWLISAIRKWIAIRIPTSTLPFFTNTCIQTEDSDPVTKELNAAMHIKNPLSYGPAPAMAISGAAAGVLGGHTINKMMGFNRQELNEMSYPVMNI